MAYNKQVNDFESLSEKKTLNESENLCKNQIVSLKDEFLELHKLTEKIVEQWDIIEKSESKEFRKMRKSM